MGENEEFGILVEVAKLDSNKVAEQLQKQLNGIGNKLNLQIGNAKLSNSAISELQKDFNKHDININLGLGDTKNIQKQAEAIGKSVGDTISRASQSATKSGSGMSPLEKSIKAEQQRLDAYLNKLARDGNATTEILNTVGKSYKALGDIKTVGDLDSWKFEIKDVLSYVNELVREKNQLSIGQDLIDTKSYEVRFSQLEAGFRKIGESSGTAKQRLSEVRQTYAEFVEAVSNGDAAKAATLQSDLDKQLKMTQGDLSILKYDAEGYNQAMSSVSRMRLTAQIQTWLDNNSRATKTARTQMQLYLNQLQDPSLTEVQGKEIRAEIQRITAEMRSMGRLGGSVTDTLVKGATKFKDWVVASGLVMRVFREVKNGVNTIRELDKALTNINYTMDVSSYQLKNIGNSAVDMAKDLHTSTSNVLQAVTLYANATETASSILEKSKPAIMLANATGFSGEQSAKYLQTIMNQFDMTQDELWTISDTVQSVSQNIAHDFSDGIVQINDAVADSGEVARAAGMDLSKYSSIIGVLVENTGLQGSQLGNAMKSIITRTTKAGKILGIDEGDISNAEKALRDIGIEVRRSDGEFKEFDNTMAELAAKWDDLTDVEKSEVSFQLAGTRQTSILKSLVKNWEEVEEITQKANNSSGTTLANQETYAKSLQGRMSELQATSESFWNNVLNSGELKAGISVLTKLMQVLDNISGSFMGLPTLITAAFAAISMRHGGGLIKLNNNSPFLATVEFNREVYEFVA